MSKIEKKLRFKLSPELADGQHWTPVDTKVQVLDLVDNWCEEQGDILGESFTVEVIEMTDAEVEALPEI